MRDEDEGGWALRLASDPAELLQEEDIDYEELLDCIQLKCSDLIEQLTQNRIPLPDLTAPCRPDPYLPSASSSELLQHDSSASNPASSNNANNKGREEPEQPEEKQKTEEERMAELQGLKFDGSLGDAPDWLQGVGGSDIVAGTAQNQVASQCFWFTFSLN